MFFTIDKQYLLDRLGKYKQVRLFLNDNKYFCL